MPSPFLLEAPDLPTAWKTMVPAYESAQYRPLLAKIKKWDPKYAERIRQISPKRAASRYENYIDLDEMERCMKRLSPGGGHDLSIRFGVKKSGHGYHGERGDFCLVGGALERKHLTLMYRSLELIGGFAYDQCLVQEIMTMFEVQIKTLSIFAARAHVFALKGNSNEKLYPKLLEVFRE